MPLTIKLIDAKSALCRSGINKDGWCLNPYGGCFHACRYCYAVFMKRFYNQHLPWGNFIIVKRNLVQILEEEIKKRKPSKVMLSTVTDAWQPIESRMKISRACVERLLASGFHVSILTKSSLIERELDIFNIYRDQVEVGITISTNNTDVSKEMEPHVVIPEKRISTLSKMSDAGIRTYAFVGPALPMNPAALARTLRTATGRVLIDKMNYQNHVLTIYSRKGWLRFLKHEYFDSVVKSFREEFTENAVETCF